MITKELRELLGDLIIETSLSHLFLALNPVLRTATLTIVQVDARDVADLRALADEMVADPVAEAP